MKTKKREATYTCVVCGELKTMNVSDTHVPKCKCGARHWEVRSERKDVASQGDVYG